MDRKKVKKMNRFEEYLTYKYENGKIVEVNNKAFENLGEAFQLFKSLFDTHYGSIKESGNLISVHTGGWSDNEELISEFKDTVWWFKYHKITANGGHYYFNTDPKSEKEWVIICKNG